MTSEYFKIKEVLVSQGSAAPFSYLKGKNIFGIDLVKETMVISQAYPDCRRIELIRNLPDRIIIKFSNRNPVAAVKLYKSMLVDEEGVLINSTGPPGELDLPQIVGLETKVFGPKAGKKYNSKEFSLALAIIKELKANKFLKDYKIKKIDVSSLQSTAFIISIAALQVNMKQGKVKKIPEGIEVKIGSDNTKNKIMILAGIFLQTKNDLAGVKYVDLRFNEPVIKLNDAK